MLVRQDNVYKILYVCLNPGLSERVVCFIKLWKRDWVIRVKGCTSTIQMVVNTESMWYIFFYVACAHCSQLEGAAVVVRRSVIGSWLARGKHMPEKTAVIGGRVWGQKRNSWHKENDGVYWLECQVSLPVVTAPEVCRFLLAPLSLSWSGDDTPFVHDGTTLEHDPWRI